MLVKLAVGSQCKFWMLRMIGVNQASRCDPLDFASECCLTSSEVGFSIVATSTESTMTQEKNINFNVKLNVYVFMTYNFLNLAMVFRSFSHTV